MKRHKLLLLLIVFLLVTPLSFAIIVSKTFIYTDNATKANLTYDALNRILQKNTTSQNFNYSYDAKNGTLTNITSETGTFAYAYDNKYRVQIESITLDNLTFNKTYIYDAENRIINISFSSGQSINYSYNTQGLLETIPLILNNASYSEANKPENRTYANNMSSVMSYNNSNLKLNRIRTGIQQQINTNLYQDLNYSYDNASNIIQIRDNANNMIYVMSYDDINRLLYANRTGATALDNYEYNYTYDSIGDLLTVQGASANLTFTYNSTHVHAPSNVTYWNFPPIQSIPILNSTRNLTINNLTAYPLLQFDKNLDDITNTISWYRNTTPYFLIYAPMNGDNATNAQDFSGNNVTLLVKNAVYNSTGGYDNYGDYEFNGNAYINISKDFQHATTDFTTMALVKVRNNNKDSQDVLGLISTNGTNVFRMMYRNQSSIRFQCHMQNLTGTYFSATNSSVIPANNMWYHVACVFNGTALMLYVNGSLAATVSTQGSMFDNYTINLVGAQMAVGGSITNYWNGSIDEFVWVNDSLTSEQMQIIYNNYFENMPLTIMTQSITDESEVWQLAVSPFDSIEYGDTIFSNNLTIRTSPAQDDPFLNSTYNTNYTTENLTVYNISTFHYLGNTSKNIINWYRNSTSLQVLNVPFEGGSNATFTKDYSGFQNNGTAGGAFWNSTGGYDGRGAYEFDGIDDYIGAGNNPSVNTGIENEFTITMWIKPHQISGRTLIGYNGGAAVRNFEFSCGTYKRLSILISNGTNYTYVYPSPYLNATENTWNFIAVRYEKGKPVQFTVNSNYSNGTSTIDLKMDAKALYIGSFAAGQAGQFNGSIDDVQIFNESLTDDQIKLIYINKTNMISPTITYAGERWHASIQPNDGTRDGELKFSNYLTVWRPIELVIGSGANNLSNNNYSVTLTVANQPLEKLNNSNYTVTLGLSIMGR